MNTEILRKLCETFGVAGNEEKVADYLLDLYSKNGISAYKDEFNNVIATVNSAKSDKTVLLEAHLDEIGFMVTKINDSGFVSFAEVGGVDSRLLPSLRVRINGKKPILGVISIKPKHMQKSGEEDKTTPIQDLYIDTGYSTEELLKYVSVGDCISFDSEFNYCINDNVFCKSLDNRIGTYVVFDVLRGLNNNNCSVCGLHSVQEEVTQSGAKTGAYKIKPDIAIVIDVTHGKTPDDTKNVGFACGNGPTIMLGPNTDKKLTRSIISVADNLGIPYELEVEGGNTGTNAWPIQVENSGIPTVLISVPLKYMHTPLEFVNLKDIENSGILIREFIKNIIL